MLNNQIISKTTFSENIEIQLQECRNKFNQEASHLLKQQLAASEDLTDRKNFKGHATASCFLLSPDSKKTLLVHNLNLNMILKPGGHCEPQDEKPLNTAIRELEEEVGVDKSQYDVLHPFAIDVDTHPIPENLKKGEPAHFHHDFTYIFRLKEEVAINLDLNEVSSFEWVLLDSNHEYLERFIDKIHLIIQPKSL